MDAFSKHTVIFLTFLCVIWIAGALGQAPDNVLIIGDRNAQRIYTFSTNRTRIATLRMPGNNPQLLALAYDPSRGRIFYSEETNHTINTMWFNGTGAQVITTLSSVSDVHGLVVEPHNSLLFASDHALGTISVYAISGAVRAAIVSGLSTPRALDLDTQQRWVYWSDWEAGRIERCRYDGSERNAVYTEPNTYINGIALHPEGNILYFVEARNDVIMALDLSTNIANTLLNSSLRHPYALASVNSRLYFSDWQSISGVYTLDLASGNVSSLSFTFTNLVMAVTGYSSQDDRAVVDSPCSQNNGGCSHLCLPLEGAAYRCTCPEDYFLAANNRTCSPVQPFREGPEVLWLEHDGLGTAYIRGVTGNPASFISQEVLSLWSLRNPGSEWSAVDFSAQARLLLVADRTSRTIYEMQLNNSFLLRPITFGLSAQVTGLAYDWVTQNIYWTDTLQNWIRVVQRSPPIEEKTVLRGLSRPQGLALHSLAGRLFWVEEGLSAIRSANLQGGDVTTLVAPDLQRPRGVTLDVPNNQLYWLDDRGVFSCDLRGAGVRHVVAFPAQQFIDLAVADGYAMATSDAPEVHLYSLNAGGLNKSLSLNRRPGSLVFYSPAQQPQPERNIYGDCRYRCGNIFQLCLTLNKSDITCVCQDYYPPNPSTGGCTQVSRAVKPTLVYTLGNQLCTITLAAAMTNVINPPGSCFYNFREQFDFRALAFDYSQGVIYFSDIRDHPRAIRRLQLNAPTNNDIIVSGVGLVLGMAVDWVAGNLYWVDQLTGVLWVSRTTGAHQKILLTGLYQPQTIEVDIRRGYIFWSEPGRIKRAYLDGSGARDFIQTGVTNVTSLVIKYKSGSDDRLFWLDASGRVGWASPQDAGGRGNLTITSLISRPHGLAVFEEYISVTGLGVGSPNPEVVLIDLPDSQYPTVISHSAQSAAIYDVVAYYDGNQPADISDVGAVCGSGDVSVCDQLCLRNDSWWNCACMDGLVYDESLAMCITQGLMDEHFLLVADDYRHIIYQLHADNTSRLAAIKVPSLDRPLGLSYDYQLHLLFWSDFSSGAIKKTNVYSHEQAADIVKPGLPQQGISRIDGVGVAAASGLVYYTDTILHQVGVVDYEGRFDKVLLTQLQQPRLTYPRALAVDQTHSHIYVTVRGTADTGAILRINMDGSDVTVLLDDLTWPSGLDIDIPGNTLYFADSHTERLGAVSLNGSNYRTVYEANAAADPFSLAKVGSAIFWTDWYASGLFRVNTQTGQADKLGAHFFLGLNDIQYYDDLQAVHAMQGDGLCARNNGGCSDLCLPRPGGVTCACADRNGTSVVSGDGMNCAVQSCPTRVPGGMFLPPCDFRAGSTCAFTCEESHGMTTTGPLTCRSDLTWEADPATLCSAVHCNNLTGIDHGSLLCPPFSLAGPGVTCHQSCHQGYEPVVDVSEIRTCQQNGNWSEAAMQCTHLGYCPALTPLSNGHVFPADCAQPRASSVGRTCYFNCSAGYKIEGSSSSVTCLENLQWNAEPSCTKSKSASTKLRWSYVGAGATAGIAVLVIFLVAAAMVLVMVLVIRRKRKLGARYRHSTQSLGSMSSSSSVNGRDPLPAPSYDVRQGSVQLNGSRAFENPMYEQAGDVQAMKQEIGASEEVTISPLSTKRDVANDDDVMLDFSGTPASLSNGATVTRAPAYQTEDTYSTIPGGDSTVTSHSEHTAFANPMYADIGAAQAQRSLAETKQDKGNKQSES